MLFLGWAGEGEVGYPVGAWGKHDWEQLLHHLVMSEVHALQFVM